MTGTLHTPNAAPRPLTADELAALNPGYGHSWLKGCLGIPEAGVPALRQLLGSPLPYDLIDCGRRHLLIGLENAEDFGFGATPTIIGPLNKWTRGGWSEDEPLVGPLLLITA
jgi:hypothetical protein